MGATGLQGNGKKESPDSITASISRDSMDSLPPHYGRSKGVSATPRTHALVSVILLGAITIAAASAAEIGHFVPGVFNTRKLAVPEPGVYGAVYNYRYSTARLNGADGNKTQFRHRPRPGGPSVAVNVGVNVSLYALAPAQEGVGGEYAAILAPAFTNANRNGQLSVGIGAGRTASAGQFNVGDIFVPPVWLGWAGKHTDISYGYGFYSLPGNTKSRL
jgi:hypothetical protein